MRIYVVLFFVANIILANGMSVYAQFGRSPGEIKLPPNYKRPVIVDDDRLNQIVSTAVSEALEKFAERELKPGDLTVSIITLRPDGTWRRGSIRGEVAIYPASVPKMFYFAAIQRLIDERKIDPTSEMERGIREMVVDSSNEATQYILDVITGTSSGPELPQADFEKWQYRRNVVNRWLTAMGYENINANQKTFCEDAYGIEQQSRNYRGQNRNTLTVNSMSRMIAEIVDGRMGTPRSSEKMKKYLSRDPFEPAKDADDQNNGFIGKFIVDRGIRDLKIWSKAGWTSKTRHDAAFIEGPDGIRVAIGIMTQNHSSEREIIPFVASRIYDGLRQQVR